MLGGLINLFKNRNYSDVSTGQLVNVGVPVIVLTAVYNSIEVIGVLLPVGTGKLEIIAVLEQFVTIRRKVILCCQVFSLQVLEEIGSRQDPDKDSSIETLTQKDLFCNKVKFGFNPMFERVKDVPQLLKELDVMSTDQLSKILLSDPMVVYLGFREGDVLKCISKSDVSKSRYRIVMKS